MIAVIDYGAGNLFSRTGSLDFIGAENFITDKAEDMDKADRIILPGDGAFGYAVEQLNKTGLWEPIKEQVAKGKPLLGICLGMQLLFTESYEYGVHKGFNFIEGIVERIDTELKLPQIGWNSLDMVPDPLLKYNKQGDYVYFVHSYAATHCDESVIATTDYGTKVTAIVHKDNVFGTQFHPEKSGDAGLAMLRAFTEV